MQRQQTRARPIAGNGASLAPAPRPASAPAAENLRAWLLERALPVWSSLGADPRGGFHEALEQSGSPAPLPRRCRLHPRQTISFALGARLGWSGPAREAATAAMTWFLEKYRRADGLFRACVEIDGAPRDERALLYDQAFALLGLFALDDLAPDPAHARAATALLGRIRETFAHHAGGFREHDDAPFQSNAQMHLFEATQAWASRLGGPFAEAADELGTLCLERLIEARTGVIDEFYDEAWRPAGLRGPRRIEPGHQYEWAWLLLQWRPGEVRNRDAVQQAARKAALRLFEIGEASIGAAGSAPAAVSVEGAVTEAAARLWPQTERLRIAGWLARHGETAGARAAMESAAAVLERYLDVPLAGLWRDTLLPNGEFCHGPAPASSLYHLAGAIAALDGVVLAGPPRSVVIR